MPTKKKQAAQKQHPKQAAKKRSHTMTDYEEETQNPEAGPHPGTQAETDAPVDPNQPPDIRTLDPHILVDKRIPYDQSHMDDTVELRPTSDPNYLYVKQKS